MSPLLNLGSPGVWVALALGGASLALVLWLSWCKPTWVFLIALAALAIRPQLLWGGPAIGYEWGFHQTLLVYALVVNALHFGVRRTPNWPILALLATFCLSLAFGDLHPKLTLPFMLMSLALLALPFAFTQVVLEPGSRRACALVIMVTPVLSVALGGLLALSGVDPHAGVTWHGPYFRLEGGTGNAGVFAALAFAGFVAALHESTRPFRPYAGYLAVVNLALVVLSGSRTAMLASVVLSVALVGLSESLRAQLRIKRAQTLLAAFVLVAVVVWHWPTLEWRLLGNDGAAISLSSRDAIWSFYYDEFLMSPIFGRGLGSGFIAASDWVDSVLPLVHNEYLHLLVVGGAVGFVLCAAGITAWFRQLLRIASPNDRVFLIAVAPALCTYAITDNLLVYSTALPVFVAIGLVLTRPSPEIGPLALLRAGEGAESAPDTSAAHATVGSGLQNPGPARTGVWPTVR